MKTLSISILFWSAVWNPAKAWEPPQVKSIKDKVRMSTLIVVGKVVESCVFDTKSGKVVKGKKQIGFHQQEAVQIKIERVLYSSSFEMPSNSATSHAEKIVAVYGVPRLSVREPEDKSEIFFLTSDADRTDATRLHHYPFFDWTNLSVPISDEAEVVRIIAAFNGVN